MQAYVNLMKRMDMKAAFKSFRCSRLVWCVALGLLLLENNRLAAYNRHTPVVHAVHDALPFVVNIGTEKLIELDYSEEDRSARDHLLDRILDRFMRKQPTEARDIWHALGSGIIVHWDGYILTNYHVVERASRIRVRLADDSVHQGVLVAGDPVSDVALIRIRAHRALPTAVFTAEDTAPLLGETVIAVGNPFGLNHTVTAGVLSALDRECRYEGRVVYKDILQTDAAVNPGSSGGPLLNINGYVMGLSVAVSEEGQNIGFAVPAARLKQLLSDWLGPEYNHRVWPGLVAREDDSLPGVRIGHVEPGSPADQQGLREGDVLRMLNNQPLDSLLEYHQLLLPFTTGQVVRFDILRDGDALQKNVTLTAMPLPDAQALAKQRLGLILDDPAREKYEKAPMYLKGVPVLDIRKGSPAEREGISPDVWLTRINGFDLQTLEDVAAALRSVNPRENVMLVIVDVEDKGAYAEGHSSEVELTTE
jgi:serine protease Do